MNSCWTYTPLKQVRAAEAELKSLSVDHFKTSELCTSFESVSGPLQLRLLDMNSSLVSCLLVTCSLLLTAAASGQSESGLAIDTLSPIRVDGSYTDPASRLGIIFNSTTDSLYIATLSGEVLVDAREMVGGVRVISLGDDMFLQHSDGGSRDYAVPKPHHTVLEEPANAHQLLPVLRDIPDSQHAQLFSKSASNLLSRPEVKLLKEAAYSLGHLGITGLTYPSILPLYMTAQRMTDNSPSTYVDHLRLRRSSCIKTRGCPPCKSHECLGMCGPGCSCWDWACGDCCYHKGCYYHDKCCRTSPESSACLLPLKFSCENRYKCVKG